MSDVRTNLSNATWIDVNTFVTSSTLPDRVVDNASIYASSLVNLFNCPIGARGPIFEPEYGCVLYKFLQEPIDQDTADSIQMGLIQAIARWEPRITLDYAGTSVVPNLSLPGYRIRISYTVYLTGSREVIEFEVTKTGVTNV